MQRLFTKVPYGVAVLVAVLIAFLILWTARRSIPKYPEGGNSVANSHIKVMGGSISVRTDDKWNTFGLGYVTVPGNPTKTIDADDNCNPTSGAPMTTPATGQMWMVTVKVRDGSDYNGSRPPSGTQVVVCSDVTTAGCVQPNATTNSQNVYAFLVPAAGVNTASLLPWYSPLDHSKSPELRELHFSDSSCSALNPNTGYCEYQRSILVEVNGQPDAEYDSPEGLCHIEIKF